MSKLSAIRILMTLCLLLTGTSALFSQIVSTTAGMRFSIISKSQKTCTLKSISYLDEQDVVIPDTVEINGEKYKVIEISSEAFYNYTDKEQIKSVSIPEGVIEIGDMAFSDCRKLESVKLPNSLEIIGKNAFRKCQKLESVNLPNSLEIIGDNAFPICTNLKSIIIPANVKELGYTFCHCSKLASVKFAPQSKLQTIWHSTFYGCSALTSIKIPKSCQEIMNSAFMYSGLKKAYISPSTKYVKERYPAFPEDCVITHY